MYIRTQQACQAIITFNFERRRPWINRDHGQSSIDCCSRRGSYPIGLWSGPCHYCISLLCQGIGEQKFQAAYLIAAKAKTCEIVALDPQPRPCDGCRQAGCLLQWSRPKTQGNTRDILPRPQGGGKLRPYHTRPRMEFITFM